MLLNKRTYGPICCEFCKRTVEAKVHDQKTCGSPSCRAMLAAEATRRWEAKRKARAKKGLQDPVVSG